MTDKDLPELLAEITRRIREASDPEQIISHNQKRRNLRNLEDADP
ncbi:MAG TPA: hypothetical protein VF897_00565 [Roseiflexaceae bacterium]